MNLLLTACLLFIFCAGHHHHHQPRAKPSQSQPPQSQPSLPPEDDANPLYQTTNGKTCKQIIGSFDSWTKRDDFVSEFPVAQQRRVLECLNKKNPGEPR